jgi:hypothetical protein
MKSDPSPAALRRLSLALVVPCVLTLAACGGDGDGPPTGTATVNAAADSASLAWNAPVTIDVLANDSASSGALTLASAGPAGHGSVQIDAGRLVYTPAPGFFGDDGFSYTVRADDGGATATALVSVSIQARLQLSGVASDAPLADAEVLVEIGGTAYATRTNAAGEYSVPVSIAQPGGLVAVSARGSGAQSQTRLVSLVGDADMLVAAADADGNVASTQLPALDATQFTTALAALVSRNGTPTTAAALAQAAAAVPPAELLNLATLIHRVADQGLPLPAGVADTFELASNRALADEMVAAQLQNDFDGFLTDQAAMLAQAPTRAKLDTLATAAETTLVYLVGPGNTQVVLSLRPDGSARVDTFAGRSEGASWVRTGSTVTLTLAAPQVSLSISFPVAPTFDQYNVRDELTGFVIRHLSGDATQGTAVVVPQGRQFYVDGPLAGQTTLESASRYGTATLLASYIDVEQRTDFAAADVAPGAQIAGVLVGGGAAPGFGADADMLRFDSAGTATLLRTQQSVSWSLADRWLTVTRANGESRRYARLTRDPASGLENWLVSDLSGNNPRLAINAVTLDAAVPLFDAASATRHWRYADLDVVSSGSAGPDFSVYAGGGATQSGGTPYSWSVDAQGRLQLQRFASGQLVRERRWTPLKRVGDDVLVMEYYLFVSPGFHSEIYRVRWLRDLGST